MLFFLICTKYITQPLIYRRPTMDNRKFEQLIDLIINENEDQAKALFHDIVVEKSREIYESMMDEDELEEGMHGHMGNQVGGMLDEIDMEEQGMNEEDDVEGDDEFADIDVDAEDDGEMPEGDLEDRVVELEDKLDELMAEFEELMGAEEGEEDFGGDEEGSEEGNPFGGDDEGSDDEEAMMEATNLIAVKKPVHGDNGVQTRSTVSGGPKVPGNGAKAVNFSSGESTKGGTQGGLLNPTPKDIPGTYKNAPGQSKGPNEKGESVAKPKHGDDGVNTKSIVGESKKTTRRTVR